MASHVRKLSKHVGLEPKEDGAGTVFGLSGREFLAGLRAAMLGRGHTPRARMQGLWDALENMFRSAEFYDSFAVRAAIAVRTEPGQPVPAVFAEHHTAVRSTLQELVCEDRNSNAPRLANQLALLVEGAIAGAAIDHVINQDPTSMQAARELSMIALSLNHNSR